MPEIMRWFGISGSWRLTSPQVEKDVRETVRIILQDKNGVVTGGALNVDYQATDEVLKANLLQQIKVFLPTPLEIYANHYRKRASEGVITKKQAEDLIDQLSTLKKLNPSSMIENYKNSTVDTTTYSERNQAVIDASDELIAFQVNDSQGVQDTVDKAKLKGIPVTIYSYKI